MNAPASSFAIQVIMECLVIEFSYIASRRTGVSLEFSALFSNSSYKLECLESVFAIIQIKKKRIF